VWNACCTRVCESVSGPPRLGTECFKCVLRPRPPTAHRHPHVVAKAPADRLSSSNTARSTARKKGRHDVFNFQGGEFVAEGSFHCLPSVPLCGSFGSPASDGPAHKQGGHGRAGESQHDLVHAPCSILRRCTVTVASTDLFSFYDGFNYRSDDFPLGRNWRQVRAGTVTSPQSMMRAASSSGDAAN
jgi:hypothetical protein